MNSASRKVQAVYLVLLLLHTLAASLIWGVNTLFLLDAGLNNTEAFSANAFFTLGSLIFEVPTGVVADTHGRRASYLLGTLTLVVSTLLYLWMWYIAARFWAWAAASILLGIGFTFFSGAVEAWLVDALTFTGYFRENGALETVLAKGQIVEATRFDISSAGVRRKLRPKGGFQQSTGAGTLGGETSRPVLGLGIEIGNILEASSCEEALANEADAALDAPLRQSRQLRVIRAVRHDLCGSRTHSIRWWDGPLS